MSARIDLSAFPKLVFNASDMTQSFKSWLSQFKISVELTTLSLGKETVASVQVDKFRGRTKLLALLGAIGSEGIELLQTLGFDIESNETDAYSDALKLLQDHFEREKSIYVRTMKFVTVAQAASENAVDYLLRVEKLSRTMGFGDGVTAYVNVFP